MQARQLPARHGAFWFVAGFRLFRRNPPLLTALTFAYLFVVIFINLVPLVGPFLLPLILPTLTVVVANGCRIIDRGQEPNPPGLFHGIAAHRVDLLRLGGLHLLGSLFILLVSLAVEGGPDQLPNLADAEPAEMLGMLMRLLLIATPVLMAFWFSPLLTGWDDVSALKSVFFSFVASWRNWRAFTAYGLVVALVAVVVPGLALVLAGLIAKPLFEVLSVVVRMLLLFIVAPVLMASVYFSYRDVFHSAVDETA